MRHFARFYCHCTTIIASTMFNGLARHYATINHGKLVNSNDHQQQKHIAMKPSLNSTASSHNDQNKPLLTSRIIYRDDGNMQDILSAAAITNNSNNNPNNIKGVFIPINKPINTSSFDIVTDIRKELSFLMKRKQQHYYNSSKNRITIGHAGTLDPFATGLLLIGIGKGATTEFNVFNSSNEYSIKEYEFIARLGQVTDSFDHYSPVLPFANEHDSKVVAEKLQQLIDTNGLIAKIQHICDTRLVGEDREQHTPFFSAKRIDGERMYDRMNNQLKSQHDQEHNSAATNSDEKQQKQKYVRTNTVFKSREELQAMTHSTPKSQVSISKLQVLSTELKIEQGKACTNQLQLYIDVHCTATVSKGTYIRSIVYDLGELLGVGAHAVMLARTRVGDIQLQEAWQLDEFLQALKNSEKQSLVKT